MTDAWKFASMKSQSNRLLYRLLKKKYMSQVKRKGGGYEENEISASGWTACSREFDRVSEKGSASRDVKGYDEGEEYLSIWVHSIEDDAGRASIQRISRKL